MSGATISCAAGGGFRATVSPTSITESVSGLSPGTITTVGSATATPIGGSGSYTYSWTLSTQIGTITLSAVSPTLAITKFRITGASTGDIGEADAICTVTDTVTTLVAATIVCHVQLTHS